MTDEDRASYRAQMLAAEKRVPRGHVINHWMWRDGHLTIQTGRPERQAKDQVEFHPRVRRGVQQGLFD